ncbi:SRPBCC family protein [Cytophagales bacterium LB-30]|uniref:SRPBCC family protein n=1 Tax=Shiella aurantiaca TaxID=3058365 RepID=A0ABT8F687_9BACT|nr:SRPBCC family protein [Shiella aurantiaca]MDN4165486.1 SRPBCC family protein [Shiella aurantiaca]
MESGITSLGPSHEIVSTRIFTVPRALLFRAWEEPEHLKNWWGPAGFTNTFWEFDFREGGIWRFTMHGPEKGNYENKCEFIKIEKPALIAWKRHSQPYFRVLATFEEISSEETRLVFKMLFDTEEECNKLKKFVVDKNEENFDKLEQELRKMKAQP